MRVYAWFQNVRLIKKRMKAVRITVDAYNMYAYACLCLLLNREFDQEAHSAVRIVLDAYKMYAHARLFLDSKRESDQEEHAPHFEMSVCACTCVFACTCTCVFMLEFKNVRGANACEMKSVHAHAYVHARMCITLLQILREPKADARDHSSCT